MIVFTVQFPQMAVAISDMEAFFEKIRDRLVQFSSKHNAFFADLTKGDDWSFVIKSHALMESVITQSLIKRAGDPRYQNMYERMSIARKVETLKDLGVCSSQQKKFIDFYSALRNRLVHNIDELSFSFETYIGQMNKQNQRNFIRSVGIADETGDNHNSSEQLLLTKTKYVLWITILQLIIIFYFDSEFEQGKKEMDDLSIETSERLLREHLPELFLGHSGKRADPNGAKE